MQDYRNEIKEFFAVDKQLAAELEYDMKRYEEQLDKEKSDQEHVSPSRVEVGGDINSVRLLSSLQKSVYKSLCTNNTQIPYIFGHCNVLILLCICWQRLWFQSHLILEKQQATHVSQRQVANN